MNTSSINKYIGDNRTRTCALPYKIFPSSHRTLIQLSSNPHSVHFPKLNHASIRDSMIEHNQTEL